MKLEFEFKVNRALEDAFRAYLESELAGSYDRNDKAYLQAQIEEVTRKPAEDWSEGTKKRSECIPDGTRRIPERQRVLRRRFRGLTK